MSKTTDRPEEIFEGDYKQQFEIEEEQSDIREKALNQALDIRKFEIELYWKRSSHFWTFIAVALAGYAAIQNIKTTADREFLSVIVSALGFVFSLGWYFANRGSKQWQENWENHVDLLEDKVTGPLHKTVMRRAPSGFFHTNFVNPILGPGAYSVSKINQIISIFVSLLWFMLFVMSMNLPFDGKFDKAEINWSSVFVAIMVAIACLLMRYGAKTHAKNLHHSATLRSTNISKRPDATSPSAAPNPPPPRSS